jgi:fructokinase
MPAGVDALVLGGLGLVAEPTASTLLGVVQASAPETLVVLDPNCRPAAIGDPAAYPTLVRPFLARADIVKCSVEDLRVLEPGLGTRPAARKLIDAGAGAVVVTDGAAPVTVMTPGGSRSLPVAGVRVVDTVGAGDAFVAGLLAWWMERARARRQAADLDAVTGAAIAAIDVAAAACTVAGAGLPAGFRYPRRGTGS